MGFDRTRPYNDLPLLPPKGQIESTAVLKKAIVAGRMLAELKGVGETIPDQSILINSLVLQEARASSEVENIITTNDVLFEAFSSADRFVDPATKEVLHYREALWEGFDLLNEKKLLTTNLFVRVFQTIKKNNAGIRNTLGTRIAEGSTGEVVYTPPEGEKTIRDLLRNLEQFIHQDGDSIDPLIKLAIIHYQFEAIHPFTDGNGRVGRIINILYLVLKGLLNLPVLYLSKYIIDNKADYYLLLKGVTEKGDWEPWILYVLGAVEHTASFTKDRILKIRNLVEESLNTGREKLPARVYSKELIELLFHQPYTKVEHVVKAGIAERKTAAEYLVELEKAGMLRKKKIGRENLYLNIKLYELLSVSVLKK